MGLLLFIIGHFLSGIIAAGFIMYLNYNETGKIKSASDTWPSFIIQILLCVFSGYCSLSIMIIGIVIRGIIGLFHIILSETVKIFERINWSNFNVLSFLLVIFLLFFNFSTQCTSKRVGAYCNDGTYSHATGRGACSWHGGVDKWDTK